MCRHLAWLGRPRTLAALVLEPASSLLVQSYAPRRQRSGTVNAAALVFQRGPSALGETVREVADRNPAARLNLLATDGTRLVATTWGDTLSLLTTADGTVPASEPWDDDPTWIDIPDRHLVLVTPDGVVLTPLED